MNFLRWAAILPAVAATFIILFGILYLWLGGSPFSDMEDSERELVYIFAPLAAGTIAAFVSIVAAMWIAPSYKRAVALGIMILLCLLAGYGIFRLITMPFRWTTLKEVAGVIIGALIGYWMPDKETNKEVI